MLDARQPTRREIRALHTENVRWPDALVSLSLDKWSSKILLAKNPPVEAWRSRHFLVQVFVDNGIERLSVCRTTHNSESWDDGITWDELQRLKAECGRGAKHAVEIYPSDDDVVNVANMRHLWILPEPLPFAWRKA